MRRRTRGPPVDPGEEGRSEKRGAQGSTCFAETGGPEGTVGRTETRSETQRRPPQPLTRILGLGSSAPLRHGGVRPTPSTRSHRLTSPLFCHAPHSCGSREKEIGPVWYRLFSPFNLSVSGWVVSVPLYLLHPRPSARTSLLRSRTSKETPTGDGDGERREGRTPAGPVTAGPSVC